MHTVFPQPIALIDASLPNWQTLAAALPAGTDIETFTSLAQLSQWASSHAGEYTALHLFTHGASGKLQLGKDTLDASGLNQAGVQGQLQALGQALTPDGDLLLYGCNVADGQGGLEFISQLAQTTQADIAASTNLTGMHGDWALESTYGVLETIPLATDWQGELAMSITPVRMGSPGKAAGEYRNGNAFAALKIDGSVVTWGDAVYGGNSSAVAASLSSGVSQIYSTGAAFAALKSDGSVVAWGHASYGGDSSAVTASLSSSVSQIYSTGTAFAALKSDGSVVVWGHANYGGDSSAVTASLSSGVSQIYSTGFAFAARKSDGSVVAWGHASYGGDSSAVAASLSSGVSQIYSAGGAFAALKNNGSVVTWGDASYGGDSSAVDASLSSGVSQIYSTPDAFAARKSDGSVVAWGHASYGGDSSAVDASLSSGVSQIYSTGAAFAALKSDGSVVTWGDGSQGGNSSAVAASLSSGVSQIYSTPYAFAARKSDGSVVAWGHASYGGNSSAVAASLTSGVSQIYATHTAFAALKSDGSVVTWGDGSQGGNSSAVAASLTSGVSQIYSTDSAFAALKSDGSVVTWGDGGYGGNSSAVAASLASGVVGLANIATDDRYSNSAPTHIALSHSSVAENTATAGALTIGALTSTDPDTGNTFSYSVVGGTDQARFQVSGANLQFKAGTTLDYETQSSYAVTVRSTDQGGLTYDKTLTVSLSNVNETPTAASFTSAGLDNTTAITGAAVGTLAAVDPDAGDTHTFTLVAGNGSNDADNSKFTVTGNTLKVGGTALAAGTYQVMTRATDAGGLTFDQAQTIMISALNVAPTITSGASASVAENAASSTVVYTTAATDADSDTLTYSLTGTDAASFSIDATTGQIKLLTPADFEAKSSYSITVNAKDASHTTTKAVTLNVTDVDEAPSFTSGATGSVAENAATSTVVYTAAASDPESDTLTYALTGTDAASFSIDATTGQVKLLIPADFEAKSSYSITVNANDASNTTTKAVTINVTDVNEAPSITSGATGSVAENTATSTVVYTATATDPESDTLSYALTGTDAASFSIDATTGQVKLLTPADFETKSSYSITVNAKDASNTTTQAVTLNVTDVDEAPSFTSGATGSVAENAATGTVVYTAAASDPETGTVTYSLSGTDASAFSIGSSTGVVTLNASADYETKSSYSLSVIASDAASHTVSKTVTISVSDVNEAPSAANFTSAGLDNTTAITGASVGTLAAVDPDAGDTHTFTLVAGNGTNDADNSKFTIVGNTLKVGGAALTAGTYHVLTRATDAGGLTVDQAQTITISAVPVITSGASGSVAENAATSTVVYTTAATDADSDALTYALTGTDAASFSIDATTGQVRLLTPADFEVKNSYSITVNAKDASNTTTKAVTINVTDVNEAPSITSGATGSVAENAATSTVVYTATATDPESDTLSYSLTGTDAASFTINTAGAVKLITPADFETKASYSVTVNAMDATHTTTQAVTINATNVNEAPTAANFTSAGLDNTTAMTGASVGTLAAVDPDAGDTHTFTLVAGNGTNDADNSKFTITGNTLKVDGAALTAGTYHVLTRATDAGGLTVDQAQTITISAVPVITSGASGSVAENAATSTVVYTTAATDADSDALTYALTGTDAASFSIDATTGQVKLLTPADFEVKSSYSITVNAKDASHTTTKAVTINVTDVNEAPSITSAATGTVAENAATSTVVYTATATDPESDTLSYSLTGTDAASFTINTAGAVKLITPADFEIKASYSVTVNAMDATHTTTQAVTINATNVNEAPTAANFTSAGLTSSTAVTGASVGTLAAVDPDAGDTHTFILVAGNGTNDADNSKFTMVGNTLKVGGTALTTGTYQVMTRATDAGGLTVDQAQTITISAAGGGGGGGTPTPPDPTPPVTPVTPTTPTVPTEPTTPSVPTTPTEPTTPTVPTTPTTPTEPTTPTTPTVPVDPTPTIPTVPTLPVTPTIPLVDGVIITRYTRARPDGGTVNALTIPEISSERQDQDSSSPLADIALAVLQGQTLLKAEVPTGIGMTVEDLSDSPSRRTDLLDAIKSRTTAQLTDQRHLLDLGQFFLNTLPDAANLWVRTVIISQASNSDASGKLTFRGVSDSNNPSALVLDFTSLPKNSTVALENVQFGAIVGEVSVTTGDGNQLLAADSKAQTLDLGAGNDTVYAGSGNDILTNTRGNDKLFGQSGNDTLSGENGQNILHGGTDSDTAKFTGKADDYTVEKHHGFVKVINKADPSKSTLVVNSETLQFGDASVAVESAPALNALAGMYQQVLGRQADIDGFDYFGELQAKGYSMGSMALNMMKTPEGQARGWALTGDPVNDVEMLYQGLLGRNADAGGKAAWVQLLKSGSVSLDQVATAFMESPEMKTHYVGPTGWDFLM